MALICDRLFSDHIECEKSLKPKLATLQVASELYLNVLTNQITLYDDIQLACVLLLFFFKKRSLSRQPTILVLLCTKEFGFIVEGI